MSQAEPRTTKTGPFTRDIRHPDRIVPRVTKESGFGEAAECFGGGLKISSGPKPDFKA
jgi:hypothetical protein